MLFSSRPNCQNQTLCHVHNINEPLELRARCSIDKDIGFTWWINDKGDTIGTDSPVLIIPPMHLRPDLNTTISVEGKIAEVS